jgi:hypothetical protein
MPVTATLNKSGVNLTFTFSIQLIAYVENLRKKLIKAEPLRLIKRPRSDCLLDCYQQTKVRRAT